MSELSLSKIVKTLEDLQPALAKAQDVKATLLSIMKEDPQPSPDECIVRIREELPVETLFDPDLLSGPATIFRVLRDYLKLKNFDYQQDPSDIKIYMGLLFSFYSSPEEQNFGRGILRVLPNLVIAEPVNPQNAPSSPNTKYHFITDHSKKEDDERKLAHNMALRFKSDDKFSGKAGETIDEFFLNYETAAEDYNLNEEQKRKYLHNLFTGQARRHYNEYVLEGMSYNYAKESLIKEFNDRTKQESTRMYLQNLTLRKVMDRDNLDVPKGLEKLREEITKYGPSGPPEYRSDRVMVEYFCDAVRNEEWSRNTLENCYSNNWTFNHLYTSLTGAWYQKTRRDNPRNTDTLSSGSSDPVIMYEGQRMYGNPRGKRKYSNATQKFRKFDKSKVRCWNCNQLGHIHYECPVPNRQMTRNVRRAIKEDPRNANKILYEFCQQYDNEEQANDNDPFDVSSEEEQEESITNLVHQIEENAEAEQFNDLDPSDF